jgi:ligand-binding sensor domain-containing protein/signal transduction histidine kinase
VLRRLVISVIAGLTCSLWAAQAWALDPSRTMSQYMSDHWGIDRGFPAGSVTAITQTRDGYLWIGTDKGLIRFDGSAFREFQQATPTTFSIGGVQQLVVDGKGSLWILLQSTKILRYHDGKFELGRDEAEFGITSVSRQRDGTVLLSSLAYGALEYRAEKYQSLTPSAYSTSLTPNQTSAAGDNLSSRLSWATGVATHRFAEPNSAVISMAETPDGTVWLGTRDKGLFSMNKGRVYPSGMKLPDAKINCLLSGEKGELWIGTDKGLTRWNGSEVTSQGVPPSLSHSQILNMIRDRDGNLWVGTTAGLVRLSDGGGVNTQDNPEHRRTITALFEDREGNLWIGTPHGIECLRDSAFVTYTVPGQASESSGPIFIDREDRLWFGPIEGGLSWMRGRKVGSIKSDLLNQDVVYSITGNPTENPAASNDELWIGRQQGGLTNLRNLGGAIIAKTYTERDGLAQNSVYTVHQSADGTVWAGTLSGGVSRLKDGKITTYTVANGLGANSVASIADAPDGTMWFATAGGLSELVQNRWRTYTTRDGLPANDVSCILRDSAGIVWIGTTSGLAYLKGDRAYAGGHESLRESVLGIAEDHNGALWVVTLNHVLRVSRAALLRGDVRDEDIREYGLPDGLHGTEGVRRDRSVAEDLHGDIWLSMNRGLSVVVPRRPDGEAVPAIAHVESVSVDGNPVAMEPAVRIPSSHRRISIDYTGLSFAVPDRVRFRYRLDGFDQTWSEPVSSRRAIYTNLGPGAYRFRVVASNSYGQWNGSEASLAFHIAPAFWQSWWFQLSTILALACVTWLLYRLRLYQISRQFDMRLEERIGERTRIARELHDSLLQGFQGLLFHLQAAQNMLPERPQDASKALDGVLDQGDQVLAEARNAVQDLRASSVVHDDLSEALAVTAEELAAHHPAIKFRVLVEGKPRSLDPILRDEVYRFAREALRNAYNHAHADNIEAEVTYADLRFVLRIRDDGSGIDPKVLFSGSRAGHWGLPGMRERAKNFGGKMEVWSEGGAGTEVELIIPALIAYGGASPSGRFPFAGRKRTPNS